jgi:lysophospholipase L1-like esterase
VPGFYVEQELKKFKRYNDFGFNKVIFAFCINDLIAKHELREIANYENIIFPNAKLSQKSLFSLKNHSALFYWSQKLALKVIYLYLFPDMFRVKNNVGINLEDVSKGKNNAEITSAWNDILSEIDDLRLYFNTGKSELMVLIFPHSSMYDSGADSFKNNSPAKPLIDWIEKNEVQYIDLIPVYRKYAESHKLNIHTLFFDPVHPSPLGNKVVADTLFKYLYRPSSRQ